VSAVRAIEAVESARASIRAAVEMRARDGRTLYPASVADRLIAIVNELGGLVAAELRGGEAERAEDGLRRVAQRFERVEAQLPPEVDVHLEPAGHALALALELLRGKGR
jgi:hypothetical protein